MSDTITVKLTKERETEIVNQLQRSRLTEIERERILREIEKDSTLRKRLAGEAFTKFCISLPNQGKPQGLAKALTPPSGTLNPCFMKWKYRSHDGLNLIHQLNGESCNCGQNKETSQGNCQACSKARATMRLLPCTHVVLCVPCWRSLSRESITSKATFLCPICKMTVTMATES